MAGLVPAIRCLALIDEDVDTRHKLALGPGMTTVAVNETES